MWSGSLVCSCVLLINRMFSTNGATAVATTTGATAVATTTTAVATTTGATAVATTTGVTFTLRLCHSPRLVTIGQCHYYDKTTTTSLVFFSSFVRLNVRRL